MSIIETDILDTRYNQGQAFKSKDLQVAIKNKFQEDECLWEDSQLNINGGKEFSQNLATTQVQRVDDSMNREEHVYDKQQQQHLGISSQNSRRFKYSLRNSQSRTKTIEVECSNMQESTLANQNIFQTNQFYTHHSNQIYHKKKTNKLNDLIEKFPQFVSKIALISKIKLRAKHFYQNFTSIQRSRLLNKNMRYKINDKSDIIENKQYWLTKFEKKLNKFSILKYFSFPLIKLSSRFGFFMKLALLIINIIYFFLFSIFIIFQVDDDFSRSVLYLINFVWMVDIFFSINCQIYFNNQIISDRGKALVTYTKHKLIFDFLPLLLNSQLKNTSTALQILQFQKLINIVFDMKYIQLQLCIRVKYHYFIQLINLIFRLFLMGHIIACLWYLIGYVEINMIEDKESWLAQDHLINAFWWDIYFSALYWALTLMSTGSNICSAKLEVMFTAIILLFSSIAFGYIITIIGDILQEMNSKDIKKKQDTNIINSYMRQSQISKDLQSQVNIYFQQYYENDFIDELQNRQMVLDKLPYDLQISLKREQFQCIINQIDNIFNKILSLKSLQDLTQFIQEEFYFPNQILNFNQKQPLVFITQGEVEVFQNEKQVNNLNCASGNRLSAGNQFGLVDFTSGISSEAFVKSTMFTRILKINREDFINVIKANDLEYQKFCELKDNINFYEQLKGLNLKCSFCNSYSHKEQNCHLVNINKKQIYFDQQLDEKSTQKRKSFKRYLSKNDNSLIIQQYVSSEAQYFIYQVKKLKESGVIQFFNLTMSETEESQSERETSYNIKQIKQDITQKDSEQIKSSSIIIPQKSDINNRRQSISTLNFANKNSFKDLDELQRGGSEQNQLQKQDFNSERFIFQNFEPIKQNSSTTISENQRVTFKDLKNKDGTELSAYSDEKIESQQKVSNSKMYINQASKKHLNERKSNQSKINYIFDHLNADFKENLPQQLKDFTNLYTFFAQMFNNKPKYDSTNSSINQFQDYQLKTPDIQKVDYDFDFLKDFESYFPMGNSKEVISKIQKQIKKRAKKVQKILESKDY